MLDWDIRIELKGKWPKETIDKLNAAVKWWAEGHKYAGFFNGMRFSESQKTIDGLSGHANHLRFEDVLEIAINPEPDTQYRNEARTMTERPSFVPGFHQRLLKEMRDRQLVIEFSVDEEYEGEIGEICTTFYRVASNGSSYVIETEEAGDADFTARLCGKWSEKDIQNLNLFLRCAAEYENCLEKLCFSNAEEEVGPVPILLDGGDFDMLMSNLMDMASDAETYQALAEEMERKSLYIFFHVRSDDGEDAGYKLISDGECLCFAEED